MAKRGWGLGGRPGGCLSPQIRRAKAGTTEGVTNGDKTILGIL